MSVTILQKSQTTAMGIKRGNTDSQQQNDEIYSYYWNWIYDWYLHLTHELQNTVCVCVSPESVKCSGGLREGISVDLDFMWL